jgi:hypothetical protein
MLRAVPWPLMCNANNIISTHCPRIVTNQSMAAVNKRKSVLLWQSAVCTARHVCIRLSTRSIFENFTRIFFTKFSIQDLHLLSPEDFFRLEISLTLREPEIKSYRLCWKGRSSSKTWHMPRCTCRCDLTFSFEPFFSVRCRCSDGLDGPSSTPGRARVFSTSSRPAVGPTQPPVQQVPGPFLRG